MATSPIWVIGAGGHAKVIIELLRAQGEHEIQGALDDKQELIGAELCGVPIRGTASNESIDAFGITSAVIAIGCNRTRAEFARRFHGMIRWPSLVHPRAYVASCVRISEGTIVFAGVVVQPGAVIGSHAILNTTCSVDHDNQIGNFAHLAPGVHLGGNVTVGEGSLLGIGCSVLPGLLVGNWAVVGAGAVVTRNVPDDVTVMGVPARVRSCPKNNLGMGPK